MPFTDISQEYCTLIGVNCISGTEKDVITREWTRRFSPYKAFLVEATEQDSVEQIVRSICDVIAHNNIASIADHTCILSVFMDLTGAPKPEMLDTLSRISSKLNALLQCNIAAVLQFGYAGLLGLDAGAPIRSNIQTVVSHNEEDLVRTQLILVSKPALANLSYTVWLPPIILLDFLHRQANPAGTLPTTKDGKTNNDIGFLSYNEYNERIYSELTATEKHLRDLIGSENKERFSDFVSRMINDVIDGIDRDFAVDGAFQPQHPDMTVPKGKEKKAAKGKYTPYNAAAHQTESAVESTAKVLTEAIKAYSFMPDAEADRKLQEAMDASGLGLAAAADKQYMLNTALKSSNPQPPFALLPLLTKYSADHTPEIDQYLKNKKSLALYEARIALYDAVRRAYERIEADYFEKQIQKNTLLLKETSAKLQGLFNEDVFFDKANAKQLSLASTFSAVAVSEAESKSYFLLRGVKRLKMLQNETYTNTEKYYIDEQSCNIQELDDAPMKVFRLTLLDCTPQNLELLIRE